jgi:hypothetical protein
MDSESRVAVSPPGIKDPFELRTREKPGGAGQVEHKCRSAAVCCCQTFPALGPTRIDDGATGAGRHSCAETMPARTLDSAGLKCTFHELCP